jgi:DNA-binding NarL/FixJ family response regulator
MRDHSVPKPNPVINVLIVDDHILLTETLAAGLNVDGTCVPHLAQDIDTAVSKIKDHGRYDVVLLDYQIPGIHGLQAMRQLIELNQGGVALFSGVAGWSIAQAAIEQGASGFIPKTIPMKTLIHAIHFVSDGETYLPSDYLRRLSSAQGPGIESALGLKPREVRVLAHLCEGLQNKEIGREIGVTEIIVKMDVKSICRKLSVRNRTEAALAARKIGLV